MALVLLRHTRPVLDKAYCYGHLDIDLADSFDADAARATAKLPPFERIVSSPLKRAYQLAERIAEQRGLLICIDARVSEMNFGAWEGRQWSAIPRAELDAWASDFLNARPHGGETVRSFRRRCKVALDDYALCSGDTLVVCHAGVVRAVCARGDESQDFSTSIGYGEALRWPGPPLGEHR